MSDKTNTLAACPFCNSTPGPVLFGGEGVAQFVACNSCGASGAYGDTEAEAIAAWNRRAPASQPAQVGEWVKEAERLIRAYGGAEYSFGMHDGDPAMTDKEYEKTVAARAALLAHIRTRPAEDAGLLKDAERYRRLRENWLDCDELSLHGRLSAIDAAIDAAIARLGAIGADNGGEKL